MEIKPSITLTHRSPTIHHSNRFRDLKPEEDCSLIQTLCPQPIERRQASSPSLQKKPLSLSLGWDTCKLEFFKKLVDWPLEGEEATQGILAEILEKYLNILDTNAASQLSSAYCKEMVMGALLLKKSFLWKTCLELKLHQGLDTKDFYSTLELAIDVDNEDFLQRVLNDISPLNTHSAYLYQGALHYAIQAFKPQCLSVLLDTLIRNPKRWDQNFSELIPSSLLQTLIQQRKSNSNAYIENFQSCIEAVLRCFKEYNTLPSLSLTNPPSVESSSTYIQLLLNSNLKTADKKILLALFLEYHILTPEVCQENPILKHLLDVLQDQKRIKNTKKALP